MTNLEYQEQVWFKKACGRFSLKTPAIRQASKYRLKKGILFKNGITKQVVESWEEEQEANK